MRQSCVTFPAARSSLRHVSCEPEMICGSTSDRRVAVSLCPARQKIWFCFEYPRREQHSRGRLCRGHPAWGAGRTGSAEVTVIVAHALLVEVPAFDKLVFADGEHVRMTIADSNATHEADVAR